MPEATHERPEYVRGKCESCGERALKSRLQAAHNRDVKLCESCFIERCNHDGDTGVTPQSHTRYCLRCGVAV